MDKIGLSISWFCEDGDKMGLSIVGGRPSLSRRTSPSSQRTMELTASRGVGALKSSLPKVALASSKKRLAGPFEGSRFVGHRLGQKGVLGDVCAAAI
jgi:hypothetical protein